MSRVANLCWRGTLLLSILVAAGCQRSPKSPENGPVTLQIDGAAYRTAGPYAHENLCVFLLLADSQDDRDFITLDEGLKQGLVKVTEKEQEQVRELQIENQSDYPLFLQEGDRLQGGKQDRTIYASLVVPPKSGKMPVPTFCIEQGRWHRSAIGLSFDVTANVALAPKEVRAAAKIDKSPQGVWRSVARQKAAAQDANIAKNTNSSLNETLDSPEVQKLSKEFANALSDVLKDHPDAVGVAIVVNGKIEEVNIYPNHSLLGKLYPRLLQSYALQATLENDKAKEAKPVSADDLTAYMTAGKEKSKRTEAIDAANRLEVLEWARPLAGEEGVVEARTQYGGKLIHRQVITRSRSDSAPNVPERQNPDSPNRAEQRQAPNSAPRP